MKKLTLTFMLLLFIIQILTAQEGSIRGFIHDRNTKSPLIGVNVIVDKTSYGAASDINGEFIINSLPAGTYNLSFGMIGYGTLKKLNIPVNPKKSTTLNIELELKSIQGEQVIVTGKTFTKSLDATVSEMNLDFTELMNDAGSAMDVQRMMQALPSVVTDTDQNNEIIVRGGNPSENLFLIDNIEIPNPNHYGNQGTGGGPISIIDPLFIQEVDFYAGAFPARFGGKASSVMNVIQKEGSRDELHATMDMGMAGIGLNLNGPIQSGKGSYMVGFRKSYIDLIAEGVGLTAIPKYYSTQGKLVYDLNSRNKLTLNGIFGNDKIYFDEDYNNQSQGDIRQTVDFRSKTYVGGISLRTLYNENSYSLFTLSKVGKMWKTDVNDRINDKKDLVYQQQDHESEWTFKGDYYNRLNSKNNFRVGFNLKSITFKNDEFFPGDTVWQYSYYNLNDPLTSIPFPGIDYDNQVYGYKENQILYIQDEETADQKINTYKTSAFLQYNYKPTSKIDLNGGLRYSYFEYSDNSYISTRLGFTYHLFEHSNINFGYGNHYQEPSFHFFTTNTDKNKSLKSYNSNQYVFGLEHFFNENTKASLEVYYKDYDGFPVSKQWIEGDSIDYYSGELESKQDGRSAGIELFIQKKRVKNFHYTLSYSHYISELKDVRKKKTTWYTGNYDFRDVFTFVGGYKTVNTNKNWYKNLKSNKWWKYVDWLLSPGDELEISTRFRYSQGRPYTQKYYDPGLRNWYVQNGTDLNTKRLPTYQRLDIMLNRRWIYNKSSLTAYINIMNLLDYSNVWDYAYKFNGEREKINQFEFTPVGGFIWEF